jgi:uncharacterized membrane protein required for colicin V production
MADAAIIFFIAITAFHGLKRGFFREVIALFALVGATWIAVHGYARLGPHIADRFQLPADVGLAIGAVAAWFAGYALCFLIGWLLVRKLKGKRPEKVDTDAGPVTKLASHLPSRYGLVYWIDKVLGACLGLAKGAVVVFVFLFVASEQDLGSVGAATRASRSMALFHDYVRPELEALPEVKVVMALGQMRRIAVAVKRDPSRWDRVARHPALERLRAYPPIQDLAKDEAIQKALAERHFGEVIRSPKTIALLKDRAFVKILSEIDYKQVLADVEAPEAPAFLEEVAPPGAGPAAPAPAGARPAAGEPTPF